MAFGTSLQSKGAPLDVSHKADVASSLIRGGRVSALKERKKSSSGPSNYLLYSTSSVESTSVATMNEREILKKLTSRLYFLLEGLEHVFKFLLL